MEMEEKGEHVALFPLGRFGSEERMAKKVFESQQFREWTASEHVLHLFLDSLDIEWTHPEDVTHLLSLIGDLRELAGPAYLLANGGFGMLPRLAELVDGVLFESFSSRWTDGSCTLWPQDVLDAHADMAETLLGYDLNLYALDYATDPALASVVERRARHFGMTCFVSDHALSRLPSVRTAVDQREQNRTPR